MIESREIRLAVAFAVGLLIGAERERRRASQASGGFAGLRTFGLVGLLGGALAYVGSEALIVAGALIVGGSALTAYIVTRETESDRGVTTEIALVVTYALGVIAMSQPMLAAGWSVAVAGLLALRGWLHRLIRETLTEDELSDALVFLLFALVLLPIAPDVAMGPYGALNPQSLARLVVVLMAVTGAGYIAQRVLGARHGLAIAGFASGFISSTATIAAMGVRAREAPESWRSAAAGGLASNVATVVEFALLITTVDPPLLAAMALPLGLAGAAALLIAGVFAWLAAHTEEAETPPGRAFRLWAALLFAAAIGVVTVLSSALGTMMGRAGIVLVSAVAAFVDAHSTTGSIASLHASQRIDVSTAELAIVTALSTNSLTKLVMAWSGRHVRYAITLTIGVLAIAGAAWLGVWLR